MTWQPIASAPRDGTVVLGFDGCISVVRWFRGEWRDDFQAYLSLTHWAPLPAPPS